MDRSFSVVIGDPLKNINTFKLVVRMIPKEMEFSGRVSLQDEGCVDEKRRVSITLFDCPDDITAFEVCEWVRKALDSKYSVSVEEKRED